jgi:hypothetical protein
MRISVRYEQTAQRREIPNTIDFFRRKIGKLGILSESAELSEARQYPLGFCLDEANSRSSDKANRVAFLRHDRLVLYQAVTGLYDRPLHQVGREPRLARDPMSNWASLASVGAAC